MKAYVIEKDGKYFDIGEAWFRLSDECDENLSTCFNVWPYCSVCGSKVECDNFNKFYDLGGTVKEVEINLVENS